MTLEQIHIAELRAIRDSLAADQKHHRNHCNLCDRASRQRRLSDECIIGAKIRRQLRAAQAELKAARDELCQPFPGQEALFTVSEIESAAKSRPRAKKGKTR
jgi:hypothetical protein